MYNCHLLDFANSDCSQETLTGMRSGHKRGVGAETPGLLPHIPKKSGSHSRLRKF